MSPPASGETRIVPAGPATAAVMAAVQQSAFPPGDHWTEHDIARQLGLPGTFGYLAVAGGMVLARVAADEAEILTLGVHPAARRRGVARALMQATWQEARRRGAVALFLEVAAHNNAAQALYVTLGFIEVGRRRHYYADGDDAVVMRLC